MDLLRELTTDQETGADLTRALNEAVDALTEGRHKTAASLYSKRPGMVIQAAKGGVNAYNKSVNASNRNTVKLYAKDPYERKMMTKIVKELTKNGEYKVVKTKYNNGQHWELKRVNRK